MIEASIIIATYNRAESLRLCLEALSRQTQSAEDFEIVVVVDGSTDSTLAMLDAFQSPCTLQVITQPNSGQCAALNHAVSVASGRILIFLDDDIIVSSQFVAEHIRIHTDNSTIGIGRLTLSLPPQADWFAHGFAREWGKHYSALDNGKTPDWQDCFGGNMSVSKAQFLTVGGYALDLPRAYDIELAYRLTCAGCSFVYLPEAIGDQYETKGFHELVADSERSGAACVELSRRHEAMLSPLLGAFGEQRPTIATQLRILLALNISPYRQEQIRRLTGKYTETDYSFKLFQRYCFWRGVRHAMPDEESWQALIQGIPMLLYHAFGDPDEQASRYLVPIKQFEKQMAWLKKRKYKVISLQEYISCRTSHRLPPKNSVVITIDDGYADNWTLAYPILRKYGYPATIFLVSQGVGNVNTWDHSSELSGRKMLTWQNIQEMSQICFGAHTRSHPDLTSISREQVIEEIKGSRKDLEEAVGTSISAFSYPYGKYNAIVRDIVEQAGFQGSCSINEGKNTLVTPLHELRRVEIRGTDTLLDFALAIRYGLDSRTLRRQFIHKFSMRRNKGDR